MSCRPILFNGAMVRAILDGRKTVTRRPIKPRYDWFMGEDRDGKPWPFFESYVYAEPEPIEVRCPYGDAGDTLWVRENWAHFGGGETLYQQDRSNVTYKADSETWNPIPGGRWRTSLHMPRWASRLTLDVLDVRAERASEITDSEAKLEGFDTAQEFMDLWDTLYPGLDWCWRIEFREAKR